MVPMDCSMQTAVNLGAPACAAAGAAATSCSPAFSRSGRSAEPSSASFQIELQAAVHSQTPSSLLGGSSASQASLQDGTGNRLLLNADTAGDGAGDGAGEAAAVLPTADLASFLLRLLQTIAAVQAGTNSSADLPVGLSEPATQRSRGFSDTRSRPGTFEAAGDIVGGRRS